MPQERTKWPTRGLAVMAGLLAAWPVGAQGDFGPLSDGERARLEHRDVVVQLGRGGTPPKYFRAIGLVEASAERVYDVFTDFEHYGRIFRLKEAQVLDRRERSVVVRATMAFAWPVGQKWVVTETTLSPENTRFTFRRRDGSLSVYEGSLEVAPRGPNQCLVTYSALVDPGLPWIPGWLIDTFQATYLPDSIRRVRSYLHDEPLAGGLRGASPP